jgi:hypothetical protein
MQAIPIHSSNRGRKQRAFYGVSIMLKHIFEAFVRSFSMYSSLAQRPVNVRSNDCSGTSHGFVER